MLINGKAVPICDECGGILDAAEALDPQEPQRNSLYRQLQDKMRENGSATAVIEKVRQIFTAEESVKEKITAELEQREQREAEREAAAFAWRRVRDRQDQ